MTTDQLEYVRTNGGKTVHRANCVWLKSRTRQHPWDWARGKTRTQIIDEANQYGITYHWCLTCFKAVRDLEGQP